MPAGKSQAKRIPLRSSTVTTPFGPFKVAEAVGTNVDRIDQGLISAAQVCRTCIHEKNRMSGSPSLEEIITAKKAGTLAELTKANRCEVNAEGKLYKVLADLSIVPATQQAQSQYLLASCGQQILPKCLSCANLVRETVDVIGGYNKGKPWYRQALVGGHCRLTNICQPTPMPEHVADPHQNCGNCKFLTSFGSTIGNDWHVGHGDVVRVDLTPYEKEIAARGADPSEAGLAVWSAQQVMGLVLWPNRLGSKERSWTSMGVLKTYWGEILSAEKTTVATPINHIRIGGPKGFRDGRERAVLEFELGQRALNALCGPQEIGYTISEATTTDTTDDLSRFRGDWQMWGRFFYNTFYEFCQQRSAEAGETTQSVTREFHSVVVPPAAVVKRDVPISFEVRFSGGTVRRFYTDTNDPRYGVILGYTDQKVFVTFQTPWHRDFEMPDLDYITGRKPPHKAECPKCKYLADRSDPDHWFDKEKAPAGRRGPGVCPDCTGTKRVTELPDRYSVVNFGLVDPACVNRGHKTKDNEVEGLSCHPVTGPCYWHSKNPKRSADYAETLDVTFEIPSLQHGKELENPSRSLRWNGSRVVDGNGEEPDLMVFRLQLRSLWQNHPRQMPMILAQFYERWNALDLGKTRYYQPGFGAPMNVQPWAPYCSAYMYDPNLGVNLREELGDWWGDPRSMQDTNPSHRRAGSSVGSGDNYFSRMKESILSERMRVSSTGEFLQSEELTGLHKIEAMRRGHHKRTGLDWWRINLSTVHVNVSGKVGGATTTQEWMDKLNSKVLITEVDEDGDKTTFWASERWSVYGYDMFRGSRQVTETDSAEVITMRGSRAFGADFDIGFHVGYVCLACGRPFEIPTAIAMDFVCDGKERDNLAPCGGRLAWYETKRRSEDKAGNLADTTINPDEPYRRPGGPTLAAAPDSDSWIQTQILRSLGHDCDTWQPRRGTYARRRSTHFGHKPKATKFDWLDKVFLFNVDGSEYYVRVTEDNLNWPSVKAAIAAGGSGEVNFESPGEGLKHGTVEVWTPEKEGSKDPA